MSVKNPDQMPALLDRELGEKEFDAFGHRHFADALRSLVEARNHHPPFSIGLLGKWGTGKSTVKELYLRALKDDAQRDAGGRKRSDRIAPITFNAWRFGGEDIKRALLRHVFLQLGGSRESLRDALYRLVEKDTDEPKPWGAFFREIGSNWFLSIFQIAVPFAIVMTLLYSLFDEFAKSYPVTFTWIFYGALAAVAYSLKYFFVSGRFLVDSRTPVKRIELPQTGAEQYEDLLLDQMQRFKDDHRQCERIVVFLDDLDRLSAEEMVSGLDAVRMFLEIPATELPPDLGVIFVISCDEDRVAQAIQGKNRPSSTRELPASVFTLGDARRFLDRIFQFRLEIPNLPRLDMRNFVTSKISNEMPEIVDSLVARGHALQDIVDTMIHQGVQSPRSAIQIANAFSQAWWLAQKREAEGAGTDSVGGLAEHAVTAHPRALAGLSAMRVDFPDFYAALQDDPKLIHRIEGVAFRGDPIDTQPQVTRRTLTKFVDSETRLFREEHGPLRQFLASLRGLKWPETLQPLLQLSQDPLTRKLGDRAPALYAAFVSGDTRGVLAEFGRDLDDRKLSEDNCGKLKDLVHDLDLETETLRNSAYFVLADLRGRFPETYARRLLTPIARTVLDSHKLRYRIGLEALREVLDFAEPTDCARVAETLVDDFCRSQKPIEFLLETGETPSLDEALSMTSMAISIVLRAAQRWQIDDAAMTKLIDWLSDRAVAVADKVEALPFPALEKWIEEFSDVLLPRFAPQYLQLLAAQFEADDTEDFDSNAAIERASGLMVTMQEAGEQSRETVAMVIPRLIRVRDHRVGGEASAFLIRYQAEIAAAVLDASIGALVERIESRLDDPDNWGLPNLEVERDVAQLISTRGKELAQETCNGVVNLTTRLGISDGFGDAAIALAKGLESNSLTQGLYSEWGSEVLGNLNVPCVRYLAINFHRLLNTEDRNAVVNALSFIISTEAIPDDKRDRFRCFVEELDTPSLETDELKGFLNSLISTIGQRHANPSGYLDAVFPAVATLVQRCPNSVTGDMLQNVFAHTLANPDLYSRLHGAMTGKWLKRSDSTGAYDPDTIFSQGLSFVKEHANHAGSGVILLSANSMNRAEVVADEELLLAAALTAWPFHEREAKTVLLSIEIIPSARDTAGLADATNIENDEAIENLRKVWTEIAGHIELQDEVEILRALLERPPVSAGGLNDFHAETWIECSSADLGVVLLGVLEISEVGDAVLLRTWKLAENFISRLDLDFIERAVPGLMSIQNADQVQRAVLDFRRDLTALAESSEKRHDLSRILLRSLVESKSIELKNQLAGWLRELGATALVKKVRQLEEPSEDDIKALSNAFPGLRNRLKA